MEIKRPSVKDDSKERGKSLVETLGLTESESIDVHENDCVLKAFDHKHNNFFDACGLNAEFCGEQTHHTYNIAVARDEGSTTSVIVEQREAMIKKFLNNPATKDIMIRYLAASTTKYEMSAISSAMEKAVAMAKSGK